MSLISMVKIHGRIKKQYKDEEQFPHAECPNTLLLEFLRVCFQGGMQRRGSS